MSDELEGIRIVLKTLESYWSKLREEGQWLQDEQALAPPGREDDIGGIDPTLPRF